MDILLKKERKTGGTDLYYATPYSRVFIHHWVPKKGTSSHETFRAEKIINDRSTLGFVNKEVLKVPFFGGMRITRNISSKTFEEAMASAKRLHLSGDKPNYETDIMLWSFRSKEGKVEPNETLVTILYKMVPVEDRVLIKARAKK